jgi:hypothetical protein
MIFLYFIFAISVEASEKSLLLACPHYELMATDIWNCGENANAIPYAKNCAKAISDSWKKESALLASLMQGTKKGSASEQRQSFSNSMQDYRNSILALDRQIALMQKYTNIVSDYAKGMIDFPGSTGDATSAECFNSAFHDLQAVVTKLDDEIINAKNAREEAARLWGISGSYQGKIENLSEAVRSNAGPRYEHAQGKEGNNSSISGSVDPRVSKGNATPSARAKQNKTAEKKAASGASSEISERAIISSPITEALQNSRLIQELQRADSASAEPPQASSLR